MDTIPVLLTLVWGWVLFVLACIAVYILSRILYVFSRLLDILSMIKDQETAESERKQGIDRGQIFPF